MPKEITLLEALTGVNYTFTHLDGRKVTITSEPGNVIDHDTIMTADGLGMPFFKKSFMYGNLFVQFTVKFPRNMTDQQMLHIGNALSDQAGSRPSTGGGAADKKK